MILSLSLSFSLSYPSTQRGRERITKFDKVKLCRDLGVLGSCDYNKNLQHLFRRFIHFYLCVFVSTYMYVCGPHVCVVPKEARGWH